MLHFKRRNKIKKKIKKFINKINIFHKDKNIIINSTIGNLIIIGFGFFHISINIFNFMNLLANEYPELINSNILNSASEYNNIYKNGEMTSWGGKVVVHAGKKELIK